MTHSEIRAQLSEYLERDLPGERRAQIGAHLASCGECERELDGLREMVSMLRGLPEPELPAGLSNAVMARLAQGEGREARVISLFRHATSPRVAAALAAGLAGVIFLTQPDAQAPAPMQAPSNTVAPMPMRAPSSTVQPCTMARWPMVTLRPTTQGYPAETCSTAPSCTLLFSPMMMGSSSPRKTAPNQMLTCSPNVTWPRTVAVPATHAVGGMMGEIRVWVISG